MNLLKLSWPVVVSLWPLIKILVMFLAVIIFAQLIFDRWLPDLMYRWRNRRRFIAGEKWRSDRELLQMLRGMTPGEFEEYIADLFSKMGYKTEVTGGAYDEGIDVIAEKDGIRHYIQCKKFIVSEVGVGAMRDFYGAIADHLANNKAYFITTNKFTLEAERFAEDKPIELIDGSRLIEYIRSIEK